MTDLSTLSNQELADHIGAGLREAERRVPISDYTVGDKLAVSRLLTKAHGLLVKAETVVMNNGGVSARSGGDKT